MTKLEQAAPQPVKQEPVGTAGELFTMSALERLDVRPSTKVYLDAAPVRTKDLTDDEILEEYRQSYGDDGNLTDCYFARAVIAAYKEKQRAG